jgi:hypothetical protein
VPARRSNPDPPIRGQQTLGEWNRTSGSFVANPGPTSPPVSLLRHRGYPCGEFLGFEGLAAKVEGSLVRLRKFQGFLRKMILPPLCDIAETCKFVLKS